jgi:lipopolysaccharide transport system ATP-binding protein
MPVGRVGSLLEIGAGFHMELTGRENVFLSGTILGMRRREILARFDEIVEFSGVQQFIDTPVKRYSSGMYLRLAFAVAAHLDTENLLVDEVLAVGDSAFQKNCVEKLSSLVKEGRTVLFVSHNLATVSRVCDLAIVLDQGNVIFDGEVASAISYYEKMNAVVREEAADGTGDGLAIHNLRVDGGPQNMMSGEPMRFFFDVTLPRDYWFVSMGFGLRTIEGERMVFDVLESRGQSKLCRSGRHSVSVSLPALWLRPRTYVAQAKVTAYPPEGEPDKVLSDTLEFPVHGLESPGLLDPFLQPPVRWEAAEYPSREQRASGSQEG